MLHLPLKKTEKMDLKKCLFRFVEMAYSTQQAEDHNNAFKDVDKLRERVRQLEHSEKDGEAGENVRELAKYHRLLTTMQSRFTLEGEEGTGTGEWATFTWNDAIRANDKVSRSELSFEAACVLFNLAAALSYSATLEDRTTPTGLRAACQAFQCAREREQAGLLMRVIGG